MVECRGPSLGHHQYHCYARRSSEVYTPNFPVSYIPHFFAEEEEIVLGHRSQTYSSFPGEAEFGLGLLSLKGIALSKSPMRRAWPPAQAEERCRAWDAATGRRLPARWALAVHVSYLYWRYFLSGKLHLRSCSEETLLLPVQSCITLLD